MAQTGYTPILTYASGTASNVPLAANLTSSASGAELALNYADGRLFYKDSGGVVQVLATKATGSIGGSTTQVQYNLSGALAGSANMTFNGTRLTVADLADSGLTSGRVVYASAGGALVDSANLTFDGTTLTANALTTTSTVTINGGTANGVAYLNGSKVLTTGSALTLSAAGGLSVGTTIDAGAGNILINASKAIYGNANSGSFYSYLELYNGSTGNTNLHNAYAGGAITFATAGSERARIDASGNLGIGTSSPGYKLDVVGSGKATNAFAVGDSSGNLSGSMINESDASKSITFNADPANIGGSSFMRWNVDGTERMRLDADGNLLVGCTSAPSSSVAGTLLSVGTGAQPGLKLSVGSYTGSSTNISFINGNGQVGSIATSGSATTYNTSSDYRLKNITGPITTSGAYIDSLNPVEGTWKANGSTFVGLIAHEVQEASRTTVATGVKDGEEMQGMDYSNAELIANLIAEVKSLRQRLAAAGI